jgi:F-type H+-transporting ATPase subunit a
MKFSVIRSLLFCLFFGFVSLVSWSQEPHHEAKEEKFDAGELILHHIADAHEWHFATIGDTHVSIPLPVILYSPTKGFSVFSSSHFYHSADGTHDGYVLEHEHIKATDGSKVYDFSITKNVASLIISFVLLLVIFSAVAKGYRDNVGKAPKGIQAAIEPIIFYMRDEVIKPNIGEKHYRRFTPYLLTLFFFIWINNLLGLMPGGANLSGNIAVTMTLALITFFIVNFNGKKSYWGHIFAMPGVPKWLLPIMTPVEIVGVFMKPFSLMVRLFANITAGHIILLSFISMIFIFKTILVSPIVTAFSVFLFVIELLVAALQAYIFTILSASYIGSALEEHHDDHH